MELLIKWIYEEVNIVDMQYAFASIFTQQYVQCVSLIIEYIYFILKLDSNN